MADTTKTTTRGTSSNGWTDEERAAMKERAAELKKEKGRGKAKKADGEADVLEKIAAMPDDDRVMAERIHAIVKDVAPHLAPRTYYGMPAYANEDGKVICFFTPASKFKERYASFGFNADANLDEGSMWPTAWALTKLSTADEKQIAELVKQAVS
jgi:uncharacterized protein YdhG (YjbR/CyaY superfamily)